MVTRKDLYISLAVFVLTLTAPVTLAIQTGILQAVLQFAFDFICGASGIISWLVWRKLSQKK